jgi:hypothetical protein
MLRMASTTEKVHARDAREGAAILESTSDKQNLHTTKENTTEFIPVQPTTTHTWRTDDGVESWV